MNPIQASPARRHRTVVVPFFFYGLLVLWAWLANHVWQFFSLPFALTCLVLPFLGETEQTEELRNTLQLKGRGWLPAFLLAAGYVFVFHLFLWLVIHFYLGAYCLLPDIRTFMAGAVALISRIAFQAMLEEFFFRGYLQEIVLARYWQHKRIGPLHYKNIVASLLFALAHVLSYSSPLMFLTFGGSLFLGWIMTRSAGSIWPAVALHAFGNVANEWFKMIFNLNILWH